jgi:hypothetical protein
MFAAAAGLLHSQWVAFILVNCCDLHLILESVKEWNFVHYLLPTDVWVPIPSNAFLIPPPDAANHVLRQVDVNITL